MTYPQGEPNRSAEIALVGFLCFPAGLLLSGIGASNGIYFLAQIGAGIFIMGLLLVSIGLIGVQLRRNRIRTIVQPIITQQILPQPIIIQGGTASVSNPPLNSTILKVRCTRCETLNVNDAKFCVHCGARF